MCELKYDVESKGFAFKNFNKAFKSCTLLKIGLPVKHHRCWALSVSRALCRFEKALRMT